MKLVPYLLYCLWEGHARGKRTEDHELPSGTYRHFQCPRCERGWMRKLYLRRPSAPTKAE